MIKTFVYGDPHGFDFYEKDVNLTDYFKGFYISSRRGRRLVVNRRNNGDTIYSYLQYDLREVVDRPTHAFFGMSILITGNEYCPDFKTLLDFFDATFEKIVSEKNLFQKNQDGSLKYKIHKFADNDSEIQWIKICLPRIITDFQKTSLVKYDSSFSNGKAGQVVNFNSPITEQLFLDKFKESCWVSISSHFDNSIQSEDAGELELNYYDLKVNLDKSNASIVSIISSGNSDELQCIESSVTVTYRSIYDYVSNFKQSDISDGEKQLIELANSYHALLTQIKSIQAKLGGDSVSQTQHCYSCNKDKPIEQFRSAFSTVCKDCEKIAGTNKSYKKCSKCGQNRPLSDFKSPSDQICADCRAADEGNGGDELYQFLQKHLRKIISGLGILAILIIAYVLIDNVCKSCTKEVTSGTEEPAAPVTYIENENLVDANAFNNYIRIDNLLGALNAIKNKSDAEKYKSSLHDELISHLWNSIERAGESKGEMQAEVIRQKVELNDLLSYLGISDEYFDKLTKPFVDDIDKINSILRKLQITQEEYEKAKAIIDKYPGKFDPHLLEGLKAKIVTPSTIVKEDTKKEVEKSEAAKTVVSTVPGPIQVSYTKPSGETVNETKNNEHCQIFVKKGTKVTISYPNGEIKLKDKQDKLRTVRRKTEYTILNVTQQTIVYCGEHGVTITPKEALTFNE